jgi:uncharacterized protein (TIGR03067 family)
MLRPLSLVVAVVSVLVFGLAPAMRADDLKAMEGTWRVQSAEAGGKPIESDDLKNLVVTITGDHYTVMTKDGPDAGTLKLDETQKPRAMDATRTEGFDAGKVIKAIYTLADDTMRVCYAIDGRRNWRPRTARRGC